MVNAIPTLSAEQKAGLFDAMFPSLFESLIQIDTPKRLATTLYAADPFWEKTKGTAFSYDETIKQYILNTSIDTDPENIIKDLTLDAILEKLSSRPDEMVYYSVHGSEGHAAIKIAWFFPLGSVNRIVLAIRDVTSVFESAGSRLSSLTAALSEAQKDISRKNSFLSMLNQNLRTPLYSIMGLAHIAEENPAPGAFDDYLHKISMSGSYMQETIDDVLSLRQIANRNIVLDPVIIQLDDFFANIERIIRPNISAKGLLLEVDTSQVSGLQVSADARCLQQIVMKMLRSAASYTVKGGRIRLYARALFQGNDNVSLELSVENRGIVIDQERLSVLFKPFDYLNERLDTENGDLDIALIILRSSLLAMGCNTITAESDENRGTRISVTLSLPLYGEAPVIQKKGCSFVGKRVLLVDDNVISLEVSEKLLVNKGIEVTKVHNGQEAVDAFVRENGAFDLILMDILMPVMDGLTATRTIRAMDDIPAAKTVPIVALTVNSFQENIKESLMAGLNTHLVKPVEPDSLYQTLSHFLNK